MEWDNERIFGVLQKIARKDEGAMRELYLEFSRKVYAFALNHLRNPAEAEEIVVETMHEVWKNPTRFRGESKFTTWLLGIARHKVLDAIRSRRPEHEELDYEEMGETLASDEPSAFDMLAQRQRRRVHRHVRGNPGGHRPGADAQRRHVDQPVFGLDQQRLATGRRLECDLHRHRR